MSYLARLKALVFASILATIIISSCSDSDIAKPPAATNPASTEIALDDAFERVKTTLCDKQVAILGEGPNHGEGKTLAFKAKLAQSLIEDCGYSLLLFESSFYQSIKLNQDVSYGREINREDVESVISFVWRDKVEMQSLISFIHHAINQGILKLGGIDDQIGSRGQDYANFSMPVDITKSMSGPKKQECRAALEQRIIYAFSKADPYSRAKKHFILSCLKSLVKGDTRLDRNDPEPAMIENLYRMVNRDLTNSISRLSGREASMFINFEYWYDGAKQNPRTIIWTATVHGAKSGKALGLPERTPHLGELINMRFGNSAYVLGFSALAGQHALMGRGVENLPKAPENSIEANAFESTSDDIAFLSSADLKRRGIAESAAMNNAFEEKDWASLLDGLVLFREQNPATKVAE